MQRADKHRAGEYTGADQTVRARAERHRGNVAICPQLMLRIGDVSEICASPLLSCIVLSANRYPAARPQLYAKGNARSANRRSGRLVR